MKQYNVGLVGVGIQLVFNQGEHHRVDNHFVEVDGARVVGKCNLGEQRRADAAEGGVVIVANNTETVVGGNQSVIAYAEGAVGSEGISCAVVAGIVVDDVEAEVRLFIGAAAAALTAKSRKTSK